MGFLSWFLENSCQTREVVPGDVLELHCEIVKRKGSVGIGSATAFVDGEVAAEAELTFAIERS